MSFTKAKRFNQKTDILASPADFNTSLPYSDAKWCSCKRKLGSRTNSPGSPHTSISGIQHHSTGIEESLEIGSTSKETQSKTTDKVAHKTEATRNKQQNNTKAFNCRLHFEKIFSDSITFPESLEISKDAANQMVQTDHKEMRDQCTQTFQDQSSQTVEMFDREKGTQTVEYIRESSCGCQQSVLKRNSNKVFFKNVASEDEKRLTASKVEESTLQFPKASKIEQMKPSNSSHNFDTSNDTKASCSISGFEQNKEMLKSALSLEIRTMLRNHVMEMEKALKIMHKEIVRSNNEYLELVTEVESLLEGQCKKLKTFITDRMNNAINVAIDNQEETAENRKEEIITLNDDEDDVSALGRKKHRLYTHLCGFPFKNSKQKARKMKVRMHSEESRTAANATIHTSYAEFDVPNVIEKVEEVEQEVKSALSILTERVCTNTMRILRKAIMVRDSLKETCAETLVDIENKIRNH